MKICYSGSIEITKRKKLQKLSKRRSNPDFKIGQYIYAITLTAVADTFPY